MNIYTAGETILKQIQTLKYTKLDIKILKYTKIWPNIFTFSGRLLID